MCCRRQTSHRKYRRAVPTPRYTPYQILDPVSLYHFFQIEIPLFIGCQF